MPVGQKLPTTMLRFGDRERITVTLGDRSTRTLEGLDFAALQKLSPAFVEVQAPLEALAEISLLEIVTDGTPKDLAAAIRWATPRTDIAIWVTKEFAAEERAAWSNVPDGLQDHAYLVLNQIDLMRADERDARIAELQALATQNFHAFFPISAQSTDLPRQKSGKATAGGCKSLLKSLKRHVDLASQADLDRALMFLSRYDATEKTDPNAGAKPSTDRRSQNSGKMQAAPDPASASTPLQVEKVAAGKSGQDGAATQAVRSAALNRLRASATGMLSDWSALGEASAETMLDRCIETIEDLAGTLPPEDQLKEPVLQASDLIVLLQLEKSDAAAENAVTALLQLKREFEVALAA